MAKYHVKKDGTPGICKARLVHCPLGSENKHFSSIEDAQEYADKINGYADPKYSWEQMEQIRLGVEKGLDVTLYAKPELSWGKMQQIRWGLENSLGVKDNKFIID